MTKETPKSVVAAFLDEFAAGNLEGMLDYCAPGVLSIDYSSAASGLRGEYTGADGLSEQMERFDRAAEATAFDVQELITEGGTVVARTRLALTSKRSGESYDGPMLVVFRVENGRIVRMQTFPTEPETFHQAG